MEFQFLPCLSKIQRSLWNLYSTLAIALHLTLCIHTSHFIIQEFYNCTIICSFKFSSFVVLAVHFFRVFAPKSKNWFHKLKNIFHCFVNKWSCSIVWSDVILKTLHWEWRDNYERVTRKIWLDCLVEFLVIIKIIHVLSLFPAIERTHSAWHYEWTIVRRLHLCDLDLQMPPHSVIITSAYFL